jgi:hypothetical protein
MQSKIRSSILVTAAGLVLAGCASDLSQKDPVWVMLNREVEVSDRLAAGATAREKLPTDPRRIAALERLLYEPGHPFEMRRFAIDELAAIDEKRFRQDLSVRITLIQSQETLDYLFSLAKQRQWGDFTPTLVRQYARPSSTVSDENRPERAMIEQLNPGKRVERVVLEVFANADAKASVTQQAAAWELLCRLVKSDELVDMLAQAQGKSSLVTDLKSCALELRTLPRNREGLLWLAYLRDPNRRALWNEMRDAVAKLNDEQRRGLEMRHLTVVRRLSDERRAWSREKVLSEIKLKLQGAEHFTKGPTFDGGAPDQPQLLRESESKLSWADLQTIDTLLEAMRNPTTASAFFSQADADLIDTGSEHGGVLDFAWPVASAGFVAQKFDPVTRSHDLKFYASPALIERAYTSLAHYHFHAQEHRNRDFAGPGRGDMELAGRLNFNFIVLTFIDENRLNVDYYDPNGVIVDLGTMRRWGTGAGR